MLSDSPEKRVLKGVDVAAEMLHTRTRNRLNQIHLKITGKDFSEGRSWGDQLDGAIRSAEKRGTLSPENAQKYRRQMLED